MTDFERQVYKITMSVPEGQVVTYGQIAGLMGKPRAQRAVGNALHKNPFEGIVPCHRVVTGEGKMAANFGFGGPYEQKRRLLEEGVDVINFRVDLEKYQMKVLSVAEMRLSDAMTISGGVPSKILMLRAAEGIADAGDFKGSCAIISGKGNNAGDGFAIAPILKERGVLPEIILLSDAFSEDGRYYFDLAVKAGIPVKNYTEDMDLSAYDCILDCIFGTGFKGSPEGIYRDAIEKINASGAYIVSADINSGLDGNTGEGECFVKSDLTVSLGFYQPGHFLGKGDEAMKRRVNADIGIRQFKCI